MTVPKGTIQDGQKLNRLRQDIHDETLEFIASNAKESVCENEEDKQSQKMGAYLPLPTYEREGRQERAWDIYSRLLQTASSSSAPIDDSRNSIIAQLLLKWKTQEGYSFVHQLSRRKRTMNGNHDTLNFMQCDIVPIA